MTEQAWSYTSLGALAAPIRGAVAIGPFGSAMRADVYTESGVPVLRGTNISENRGWKGEWVNVSEAFADRMHRCVVVAGDLVFPHRGSIGEVALVPTIGPVRYIMSSSLMKITLDKNKIDPLFVYYYFRSREGRAEVMRFASQVGTPGIGQPLQSLRQFRLPLPPLNEQKTIGSLLSVLDDKIGLNRRMNETLEAMASAAFVEMQLLQDWPERPLGSFADIFDGPHATPKLAETGPIFLGISNLSNGMLDLTSTSHITPDDFARWTRRVQPQAGDVVFSYETRLGEASLIPPNLECCLGRRMGLLRLKPGWISPPLLLRGYLASEFQEVLRARTIHGSTVDRIPLKEMATFPMRLPDADSASELAALLVPLRDRLNANQRETETLAAIRDLVLPKLMSGELRVRDAERAVGELV